MRVEGLLIRRLRLMLIDMWNLIPRWGVLVSEILGLRHLHREIGVDVSSKLLGVLRISGIKALRGILATLSLKLSQALPWVSLIELIRKLSCLMMTLRSRLPSELIHFLITRTNQLGLWERHIANRISPGFFLLNSIRLYLVLINTTNHSGSARLSKLFPHLFIKMSYGELPLL